MRLVGPIRPSTPGEAYENRSTRRERLLFIGRSSIAAVIFGNLTVTLAYWVNEDILALFVIAGSLITLFVWGLVVIERESVHWVTGVLTTCVVGTWWGCFWILM